VGVSGESTWADRSIVKHLHFSHAIEEGTRNPWAEACQGLLCHCQRCVQPARQFDKGDVDTRSLQRHICLDTEQEQRRSTLGWEMLPRGERASSEALPSAVKAAREQQHTCPAKPGCSTRVVLAPCSLGA